MAIQAFANYNVVANFGFANSVQNLGGLAITMLALNAISNLPGAQAREAPNVEKEACEIICDPIAEGKDHPAEKTCQEICKQGDVITKTRQWVGEKTEEWVPYVGKAATGYFDCDKICDITYGGPRAIYNLGSAGVKYFWKKDVTGAAVDAKSGAAQAGCIALLATPAGYTGCMTCCGGAKHYNIL